MLELLMPQVLEGLSFALRAGALVGIVFLFTRLPMFRSLFYQRELTDKGQFFFVLLWTLTSWAAPYLTIVSAFVPFCAGLLGGIRSGRIVGLLSALFMLSTHHSWPVVFVHALSGALGGAMRTDRLLPKRFALVSGLISLAGLDHPDMAPGSWVPRVLLSQGLPGCLHLLYLTLAFSFASFSFLRLARFVWTEGDRERALVADRVLHLANQAASLLTGPRLDKACAQSLAQLIRPAFEVAAVVFYRDQSVLAFVGSHPHLDVAVHSQSQCDHGQVLQPCPADCPYGPIYQLRLADGTTMGFLHHSNQTPWMASCASGLARLLSARLLELTVQSERQALQEARLRFLQAQIRPHFLFNALNTVAALSVGETRTLVLDLSSLLRESFRQDRALVQLDHEISMVEAYLSIEKARFGERLQVHLDLQQPLPDCLLPPFTLQPLVENAILHGVEKRLQGGLVRIQVATLADGRVQLVVEDDGPGMSPQELSAVRSADPLHAQGIGLANVEARLSSLGAQVHIQSWPSRGTRIEVTLCAT